MSPPPADVGAPRHRVSVDVVVLTLADPKQLQVAAHGARSRSQDADTSPGLHPAVLLRRPTDAQQAWHIPGDTLSLTEDLQQAAARVMAELGLRRPRHVEQLASFGAPDRIPGQHTVAVSYLALVPQPFAARPACAWTAATSAADRQPSPPALAFDHARILHAAVRRIRSKLSYSNIAFSLLPDEFTMSELQEVYEAVLATSLDKRNFRKKVLALGLLVETGRQRRGSHRPAALFRFASADLVLLDDVIASA